MNADEVRSGSAVAQGISGRVIVEQQLQGRDHPILVIGGEVVAVAERIPARVVGDGSRTIADLIEIANRDPRPGEGHEKVMTKIKIDPRVIDLLARSGLTFDSAPLPGRTVMLRATAIFRRAGPLSTALTTFTRKMRRSRAGRR